MSSFTWLLVRGVLLGDVARIKSKVRSTVAGRQVDILLSPRVGDGRFSRTPMFIRSSTELPSFLGAKKTFTSEIKLVEERFFFKET